MSHTLHSSKIQPRSKGVPRRPSQSEIIAFFQGYRERDTEVLECIQKARQSRKSIPLEIMKSSKRNIRNWMLRAERDGFETEIVPSANQIVDTCWLSAAFVLGFAIAVIIFGGAA